MTELVVVFTSTSAGLFVPEDAAVLMPVTAALLHVKVVPVVADA